MDNDLQTALTELANPAPQAESVEPQTPDGGEPADTPLTPEKKAPWLDALIRDPQTGRILGGTTIHEFDEDKVKKVIIDSQNYAVTNRQRWEEAQQRESEAIAKVNALEAQLRELQTAREIPQADPTNATAIPQELVDYFGEDGARVVANLMEQKAQEARKEAESARQEVQTLKNELLTKEQKSQKEKVMAEVEAFASQFPDVYPPVAIFMQAVSDTAHPDHQRAQNLYTALKLMDAGIPQEEAHQFVMSRTQAPAVNGKPNVSQRIMDTLRGANARVVTSPIAATPQKAYEDMTPMEQAEVRLNAADEIFRKLRQ